MTIRDPKIYLLIKKPGDPRLQREKDPFDTDRHIERALYIP